MIISLIKAVGVKTIIVVAVLTIGGLYVSSLRAENRRLSEAIESATVRAVAVEAQMRVDRALTVAAASLNKKITEEADDTNVAMEKVYENSESAFAWGDVPINNDILNCLFDSISRADGSSAASCYIDSGNIGAKTARAEK